jgi:hypothetical protein
VNGIIPSVAEQHIAREAQKNSQEKIKGHGEYESGGKKNYRKPDEFYNYLIRVKILKH